MDNTSPNLQIGAFSGHNRRPQPAASGLVANFYGENGPDSDSIAALSLTKYLEIDVFINIYVVKDSDGRVMKDHLTGQYPKVCSFLGKIQRPKPQRDGMLAQFFASNGPDADQVNELGLSKYLDALVYVEILDRSVAIDPLAQKLQVSTPVIPQQELEQVSKQLTSTERKHLAKKLKAFDEAHKVLTLSGFFNLPDVWALLGNPFEFSDWLKGTSCCWPSDSPCEQKNIQVVDFTQLSKDRYGYLPLCVDHHDLYQSSGMPGASIAFMRMRKQVLIQMWAQEQLKKTLGTKEDLLDPHQVLKWAADNKLNHHVPSSYLSKLSS